MYGKEAAAVELTRMVADAEATKTIKERVDDPRKYYFKLFNQCLEITGGADPDLVLQKDRPGWGG